MTSDELLAVFRAETTDNTVPYFWADSLLYVYMNDAQKMFCRLTEGIEDSSTTSICRLAVAANTEWYPTSKLILKVREATDTTTGRPYDIVNAEKASEQGIVFRGQIGPLRAFVTGLEKSKLRAWPMPNAATTVELRVFRLPLENIEGAGQDFEIDEQHHLALLLWMKHRAYGVEDADVFNRFKSEEYEQKFRAYCAAARVEQERARRSTGTVSYGGI